MGHYYEAAGQPDLAEREMRDAVRLDPGSLFNQNELGWTLFFQRRDEEALKVLQDLRDADPTFLLARESLAFLRAIRSEHDKAMEEADALRRHAYVWPGADAIRAYVLAMGQQTDAARKELIKLEGLPEDSFVMPYEVAAAAVAIGDHDRA